MQHVYYQTFEDRTSCSPCTCESPTGGNCSAVVQLFKDTTCSEEQEINAATVFSSAGICNSTTMPIMQLTSMKAKLDNHPGACASSGGQVIGEATPTNPSTFCCLE